MRITSTIMKSPGVTLKLTTPPLALLCMVPHASALYFAPNQRIQLPLQQPCELKKKYIQDHMWSPHLA